jgi:hypothetical protein
MRLSHSPVRRPSLTLRLFVIYEMNKFNLYVFVHCIGLLVSISRMLLTLPNLSNVDPLLADTTMGVINGFTSSTSPNVKQFGNTVIPHSQSYQWDSQDLHYPC